MKRFLDAARSGRYGVHDYLMMHTKSRKNRSVPMNSAVRDELLALDPRTDGDRIFGANGNIQRPFARACCDAEITDFRFHDLRHTAATRLADRGASAFEIAGIFGHSTIQMSARYTHATSDGLRRAMESLTARQAETLPTNPPQKTNSAPVGALQVVTKEQDSLPDLNSANGDRTRTLSLERAAC